ncbi:MAG: hypothetical protein GXO96_03835 [Nitrospirae bacterium]|nr:hypothetical protein [Candidatus Manganitrophaceae bacterium]
MSLHARAKFLFVVSIIFGLYSFLWGLAPFPTVNFPARLILDAADWPIDNLSTELDRNTMFLSAIGAGLLRAISIFLGKIVVPAVKEGNKSIINATILAMSVWYTIDGIGSIAAGVSQNVIFNSIYLVLVLIPLVGIKENKT